MRRWWDSIREPRHKKAAYFVLYIIVILTGAVTLIVPPTSISGELGPVLSVSWSVFWLIGGMAGGTSVLPGWWWMERLSIVFMWTGFLIYFYVVFSLHFSSTGSRLTQVGVILVASAAGYIRWLDIHKYNFEPRV